MIPEEAAVLTTYYLLLTTYYVLRTTYRDPRGGGRTYYLLLTTYYVLLTTYRDPRGGGRGRARHLEASRRGLVVAAW